MSRWHGRSAPLFVGLSSLIVVTSSGLPNAHAEADAGARTLAVQLFDEAEALFANEQVAEACPKYAESYRLDPQLGVLIYLAECYEKGSRLASAWGSFREAEELANKRGDPRAGTARARAAALELRLSYVLVQVAGESRVPGLEIMRDGVPLAPVVWGSKSAADTGPHRVEARAPGYETWQAQVTLTKEGEVVVVKVPRLKATPKAAPVPGMTSSASPLGTPRRIAAIAAGGLGLVGMGVGGFFGLSAQASLSDSSSECNQKNYCTVRGDELRSSGERKALVATVATGAGAAALIAATVLWFTSPSKGEQSQTRRPSQWAFAPRRDGYGLEVGRAF